MPLRIKLQVVPVLVSVSRVGEEEDLGKVWKVLEQEWTLIKEAGIVVRDRERAAS